MNPIRLIDTTLRDGSHAVSHSFTPDQVSAVCRALDATGADTVEVAHGDGLMGSSFQYGFSAHPERDLLRAAGAALTRAKLCCLLIPGIGTLEYVEDLLADGLPIKTVRVATHATEADVASQHLATLSNRGIEAIGFLMMAHMATPERLAEEAAKMVACGAETIILADSAGTLTPDGVKARVSALRDRLGIRVGFHAHNNLGLAVGNSLAALEAGAECLDVTLRGLGASAGNAPHEVMVAVLRKTGRPCAEDLEALEDAAEDLVAPLMQRPLVLDRNALTIGYAGVYGSFFLHAVRAAERFGVETRRILYELGRMNVVGGQEDMILDVASRLAKEKEQHG